jgi:SAM-dependent methyltransferase
MSETRRSGRAGSETAVGSIDAEAFRKFEHDGWVEVAGRYHDSFSRLTTQAVEPTLDAAGVRSGVRHLDVASGPGYLAAAAARRGANTVGVDFSPTMVIEARRRHPGIEFREGDAESLPFEDGHFEAVTIGFGMPHFARPERVLTEMHRVLAPGGRLAFTTWDENAMTFRLILDAVKARGTTDVPLPEGPGFFEYSDPQEGRRVLTGCGFVDPAITILPLMWSVESTEALLRSFLEGGVRTRGLLRAQSPEQLDAIRAEVAERARVFQRGDALELPTPAVLASAVRP